MSLLAESVFPTDIIIGVYDRRLEACPPSQLIPKSAGPRFNLASYIGLIGQDVYGLDNIGMVYTGM